MVSECSQEQAGDLSVVTPTVATDGMGLTLSLSASPHTSSHSGFLGVKVVQFHYFLVYVALAYQVNISRSWGPHYKMSTPPSTSQGQVRPTEVMQAEDPQQCCASKRCSGSSHSVRDFYGTTAH